LKFGLGPKGQPNRGDRPSIILFKRTRRRTDWGNPGTIKSERGVPFSSQVRSFYPAQWGIRTKEKVRRKERTLSKRAASQKGSQIKKLSEPLSLSVHWKKKKERE